MGVNIKKNKIKSQETNIMLLCLKPDNWIL